MCRPTPPPDAAARRKLAAPSSAQVSMAATYVRGLPHNLPVYVKLYFLATAAASLAGIAWRRLSRHVPPAASSYVARGPWLIACLRLYGCVPGGPERTWLGNLESLGCLMLRAAASCRRTGTAWAPATCGAGTFCRTPGA